MQFALVRMPCRSQFLDRTLQPYDPLAAVVVATHGINLPQPSHAHAILQINLDRSECTMQAAVGSRLSVLPPCGCACG